MNNHRCIPFEDFACLHVGQYHNASRVHLDKFRQVLSEDIVPQLVTVHVQVTILLYQYINNQYQVRLNFNAYLTHSALDHFKMRSDTIILD